MKRCDKFSKKKTKATCVGKRNVESCVENMITIPNLRVDLTSEGGGDDI